MPKAGGSSTITGVDFEAWFVALKFADAFFDEGLQIKPQAQTYINPKTQETEITSIDDIHVTSPIKNEFYNLKFRAPNIKSWSANDLKNQKVLSQLKAQFLKSPDAISYFVTQSPCPILHEIIPRGTSCSSREELEITLKPNNYIDEWDNLKKELELSDEEMISFSKQVKYKHVIDTEELKELISQKFHSHVTNASFVPNCLYQLAIEAGKQGETIGQNRIISYLTENNIHLKSHFRPEKLLVKISFASAGLLSVPNTFFEDCHLERKETNKLFDWIREPLPEDKPPIAVLTGKAGCGKSVILKDLLEKLNKEKVPVLGIKTDLLMMNSITQLSSELDLADGIKETLSSIVEKYGKAVILFDQIDALSQTMSTDRKVINSYINLISQLSLVLDLRIIISCRTFDLKYDPLLRSFEDKYTIDVGDLNEGDIEFVLSRMGIEKILCSKTLMDLLKVPLHLKVFCDIYEEKMNLASLNTLQDLYDVLWDQRIFTVTDKNSVLDAIEITTEKMDESKALTIPFALLDRNDAGRQHLLSQSILVPQKKTLQFFHQSFFDYCYSRTFLNRHGSLIGVILQQHQGLFVRPQIKQVLAYLRGSDFPKYLQELKEFLNNKNVRFHIWLLVVNQLAFVEDPTDEEWQIIKPILDTETDFRRHFIDALQSEQWLKYLITSGYVHTFLKALDNKLVNVVAWKLRFLINSFTDMIVAFLCDFPDIEKKNETIWNILFGLDHWENNRAVELLKGKLTALKKIPDHDYYYYHFMNSLFPYKPEIVCRIFFDNLNEKLGAIRSPEDFDKKGVCDYQDMDMFQKIGNWNKDVALSEGLKIICDLVEKTKLKNKVDFYNDRAFLCYEQSDRDLYEHWKFLGFVQEKLEIVAKKDKQKFLRLVTGFQDSHFHTLLKLLIQGYLSNPKIYVGEGFRLLTRNGMLEEVSSENSGGHELRTLLKNIYSLLSLEQKETINNLMLSVAPDWENNRYPGGHSSKGYTRYRLLCAIPEDELKKYPLMKKQFHELERKFGIYKEVPPVKTEVVIVGPPLPDKAYEEMTHEQWISSFKKYDDSTGWDRPRNEFGKGGLVEHSRVFTEQVSKRPDNFYSFIVSLGQREDISTTYLEAGLNGLVKAKYNIEKIKDLVKAYWGKEGTDFRKEIISAISFIDKEDSLDLELISILEEYSLHDPDPDKESWMIDAGNGTLYYGGDPIHHGINSVRGSAAERLAIHGYKTTYADKVFEIMDKIAGDASVSVRCCLIRPLAGMLKWDRDKTHDLFMKLTDNKHPQIIKYGLECLSWLITKDNFSNFIPHIRVAMDIDERHGYHHMGEYVGQILMLAYTQGYPDSSSLLEEGFQKSDKIKAGAIQFASKHLLYDDNIISEKSKEIFLRFINEESKDINNKYAWSFREFKPVDFRKLYNLIESYTRSKAVCKGSEYFLKYLTSCVAFEPKRCLDLLQNYTNFEQPNFQLNALGGDELVQIIIGAYNKLIDDGYKEKAMDVFDNILKDETYKSEGLKVLAEQDRG